MARLTRSRTIQKLSALRRLTLTGLPQYDVVIYDSFSRRHLYPLLDMTRTVVFETDSPRINFWALLGSLRFGRPSSLNYLLSFLKRTCPRVVITTSDNSLNLYLIKKHFPGICVIAIQNGRRNTFGPRPNSSFQTLLASSHVRPTVDYYFTFGSTEQVQFTPLVDATFIAHGSLKNNYLAYVAPDKPDRNFTLSYISSFPNLSSGNPPSIDSDLPTHFFGDSPISYRNYFLAEYLVASFLQKYCDKRNITFQVIAKQSSGSNIETEFFRRSCNNPVLVVHPCSPEGASYQELVRSDFVVSIDSTLAYEMLGRGKRTAFLTIRASSIGLPNLQCPNFGYPEVADISGPFWTNVNDESEFTRVLDFTIDSSSDQWSQAVSRYVPTVMSFDPDNSRLFAILEELGVSHGKGIAEVRRRARDTYGV